MNTRGRTNNVILYRYSNAMQAQCHLFGLRASRNLEVPSGKSGRFRQTYFCFIRIAKISPGNEGRPMEKQPAKRTCPECGSQKYLFRGRRARSWRRSIDARRANMRGRSGAGANNAPESVER